MIPTLLCPNRSLATLGWTPLESRCVAQVVEANAQQTAKAGKKADPFLAEAVRAHGRAVLLRDHEIILRHALAELQQLLCFNSVSKVPDKAMVRPRPVFGSS